MNPTFIKGLELSQLFYHEAVKPILDRHFPELAYSAARIGHGSDVLGFDTPQSMDHDWGPKLMLFLSETDFASYRDRIDEVLRLELPVEIHGYPTNFGHHNTDGTTVMAAVEDGSINHEVKFHTVQVFFTEFLGFNPTGEIRAADWVSVPGYRLGMLTAGRVFHDGLGVLTPIREKLQNYPYDVWLYLLAAQWQRISQEEAFMGRCAQVGDDLGSRLVAARLVMDLVRLCFLMERRYAPYIKWLGTAFSRLSSASDLSPVFTQVLQADTWEERQSHLTGAFEYAARRHNALAITAPLDPKVSQFHLRPFTVIHAERFVDALRSQIQSAEVLALPKHLGSLDQISDSTDALDSFARFRALYEET